MINRLYKSLTIDIFYASCIVLSYWIYRPFFALTAVGVVMYSYKNLYTIYSYKKKIHNKKRRPNTKQLVKKKILNIFAIIIIIILVVNIVLMVKTFYILWLNDKLELIVIFFLFPSPIILFLIWSVFLEKNSK